MLSAAKHLLYLLESKQKQILRFAQNDVLRAFFSILLEEQNPSGDVSVLADAFSC
jgi:hypothetical protein